MSLCLVPGSVAENIGPGSGSWTFDSERMMLLDAVIVPLDAGSGMEP